MNTLLVILAVVCVAAGILGAIVPGLPGPPIAWAALLLLYFTAGTGLTPLTLLVTGLIAALITVLDYVFPSVATKRFGGSKAGVWGCNIGLVISIVGLPFGPQGLVGLVFWPFAGALVGELLARQPFAQAARAAFGAFIGFLCGTFVKLVYGIVVSVMVVKDLLF